MSPTPQARWSIPVLLTAAVGCLEPLGDDGQRGDPAAPSTDPAAVTTTTAELRGDNMSGSNLGASNLGGINLGGINVAGNNLGGINLGGINMGGNNLGANNLAATNLGGINLGGINLGGINLGGINLAASNLSGSNLGGINVAGNNLTGTNLTGTNLGGINSGSNVHGLAGTINGMLYSGEDLWMPKTGQCIVMGVGSTAFAKLLGQQSANARMSVALGRLPWGFATASGGPMALSAWEAVVWGDKTYCSFVLATPTDSTWAGVAGFVKAVFRWHAPPTQTIDISGIEASAPHDPTLSTAILNYTGMMNAAARWRAGTISERSLVAGEMGFISATTNNQSVRVDFSSWIIDSSNNGLVLGNVDTNPRPMYSESIYYTYDNGDGSLGVGVAVNGLAGAVLSYAGSSGLELFTGSDADSGTSVTAYKAGQAPRPTATRCASALYLAQALGEPLTQGKCDSGLALAATAPTTYRRWNTVTGTTVPLNYYQMLPQDGATPIVRDGKTVLAETYIHMWEPNHFVNAAGVGRTASGDRAELGVAVSTATACATGQTAVQAFDNNLSTKWCASGGAPSSGSPRSIMYMWGASIPITSYAITSAVDYPTRDPKSWTFQGCAGSCTAGSDSGWVTLDTRSAQTFSARAQARTFSFSNSTAYQQYRLRVTANNGDGSYLQMGEVNLFDGGGAVVPLPGGELTENGVVNWVGLPCSADETASRAFDNLMTASGGTEWCALGGIGASPASLMYSWNGAAYRVTSYSITSAGDYPERDPRTWTLQGCDGRCYVGADDGWVTLDTRSSQSFTARYQKKTFTVSNGVAYQQYRLRVSAVNGAGYQLQLAELQLFNTATACIPESNAAFCARRGNNCGSVAAPDNCGVLRTVTSCGSCSSPQTCGGGGVPNVCGGGSGCAFSVSQNTYDGPSWWGSVTFSNSGPATARNYRVEFDVPSGMSCTNDAVPTGATLSPLTGSGLSARTVSNHCVFTWTNGSALAPGASKTFNYSANRTTTFNARSSTFVRDSLCNP
jgi:hypothetical protein